MDSRLAALQKLLDIIARLRGPGGCPWDREQTLVSMAPHLIEEASEVVDAVESQSDATASEACEELGDLLANVFLCAQIADDDKEFSVREVADGICEKLVRRHPHVFGDAQVKDAAEVLERWSSIKAEEKQDKGIEVKSRLDRVPRSLPPLLRAQAIGKAAAKVGFDWPDASSAFAKIQEELEEVQAVGFTDANPTPDTPSTPEKLTAKSTGEELEEELGDLLFAVANLCRKVSIPPDRALRKALKKFTTRFRYIEGKLPALEEASPEVLDSLWREAKAVTGEPPPAPM